jgi:hypothetical protein
MPNSLRTKKMGLLFMIFIFTGGEGQARMLQFVIGCFGFKPRVENGQDKQGQQGGGDQPSNDDRREGRDISAWHARSCGRGRIVASPARN